MDEWKINWKPNRKYIEKNKKREKRKNEKL